MSRLSVLMTVFNEADFIDFAIRGCLPYVDDLVIVEGSYLETQKLGQPERSNDGTVDIIEKYKSDPKVHVIYANEQTDKDQRNVGLRYIKDLNPDGWLLIIDGDEIYKPTTFQIIRNLSKNFDKQGIKASYFRSITFVNDIDHYCYQDFPRLFKITPECQFVNDNFMQWKDASWAVPFITQTPSIKYHHYSFAKNKQRIELKKRWWETRFGKEFDYGWHLENNKWVDKGHTVYKFIGTHPEVLDTHKLVGQNEQT